MISAGYIGGGETAPAGAPPPVVVQPQVIQPPTAAFGTDGTLSMPIAQGANASDLNGTDLLNAWKGEMSANRTAGYWQMGVGAFTNLIGQWASYAIQSQWLDTNQTIADRRALAAENISDDRKEVELRLLETQDKISRRTDGPGGSRERLARINANRDVEMYDRRMDTQERVAAMRGLDQAFSMRPDYNYGTPYSPYA